MASSLFCDLKNVISCSSNINGNILNNEIKKTIDNELSKNVGLLYVIGQKQYIKQNSKKITHLPSVLDGLKTLLDYAVKNSFPDYSLKEFITVAPTIEKYGDYQFNGSMNICQKLKSHGLVLKPHEVASKIIQSIPPNNILEKVDVAGPGFINLVLNKDFILSNTFFLTKRGLLPYFTEKKRIVVDFSSPNIAKEMHVGHLRSSIIGDSICNLLEFLGHDVVRLNHIGDWGTQFGMLIAYLERNSVEHIEKCPDLKDLQKFYKRSKELFDNDPEFKKTAHKRVVDLQNGEESARKAWKIICDTSMKENQLVYDRLGITLTTRGESFYQNLMQNTVKQLTEQGLIVEDKGCKVAFVDGFEVPLIMVKSDGGFTYDTSDVAALRHRLFVENADWVIYVVDSGQSLHFNTFFGLAKKAKWFDPQNQRIEHVGFGVVLGEDKKKFKTRSGEVVKLSNLLDEGVKRAKDKIAQRQNLDISENEAYKICESVAYGCIKYSDLSHNRTLDYVFSFDKMLDDKGNTAVYCLYAYTRIRAILRNAKISDERITEYLENLDLENFRLENPKEYRLAKHLSKANEVIFRACTEMAIHSICEFVYSLANYLTEFYDECYCVTKDKQTGEITEIFMDRIVLLHATANVFHVFFKILGIKPLERM